MKHNSRVKKKLRLWKNLSPFTSEEDVVQKWYACVYRIKGKSRLHIGKALQRFLLDQEGPISALEMERLKPNIVSTNTILESVPAHLGSGIKIFPVNDIIAALPEILPMKNGRWNIPSYSKLHELFENCKSMDRNELYKKFQIVLNMIDKYQYWI